VLQRFLSGLVAVLLALPAVADESASFAPLADEYGRDVRPLVKQFCLKCHSTDQQQGELDLERFAALADVRKSPRTWIKVVEQLDNGEMPPKDADQPTAAQRKSLRDWARKYLDAEARASAGDPGRVILRRLSNVEYDLTIRDLTGVDLRPTKEFPGDGAAGEGFTNTGEALVMSPALLEKYLHAAKGIAAHAVLSPDGLRFSPHDERQDWSDDILHEIQAIYRQHVDVEGRVNLARYFAVLLKHRARLLDRTQIDAVAVEEKVNANYLRRLALVAIPGRQAASRELTPLMQWFQQRFANAQPADAPAIAGEIRAWQDKLFQFQNVGHFKPWQTARNAVVPAVDFRLKLASGGGKDIRVYLAVGSAGDDGRGDVAVWQQPRLELAGRPPIMLRDVPKLAANFEKVRQPLLSTIHHALAAAGEAVASTEPSDVQQLAEKHKVNARFLAAWLSHLGIGSTGSAKIEGLLTQRLDKAGAYDFVQGWGMPGLGDLSILANKSDQAVRIPGTAKAKGVVVHPRPERAISMGWVSPIAGTVKIEAEVAHAHPDCGNGVSWWIEQRRGATSRALRSGNVDLGKVAKIEPSETMIRPGELVSLTIGARDNNHACDLTAIDLIITELDGEKRQWRLSKDVVEDGIAANPHADSRSNKAVWHFYSMPPETKTPTAPASDGSLLAKWLDAASGKRTEDAAKLADQLQTLLVQPADKLSPADAALRTQLLSLDGPLFKSLDIDQLLGADKAAAGSLDYVVSAPVIEEFVLPTEIAVGRELVVRGTLDPQSGGEGSVQLQVAAQKLDPQQLLPGLPFVVRNGSEAEKKVQKGLEEFRELFPAAMCYYRVVPVDEVITLVIYHREDEHLQQLMLDDATKARLDRLWDELRYVSQDALKIDGAYEQFLGFVSQEGPTAPFEPLRKPIRERADALRAEQVKDEPKQLDAAFDFARRAYRRPLAPGEQIELQSLYGKLRKQDMPHEDALRLTLARVLVSPAFLYRVESPAAGEKAQPVSDFELASRLSYFLWSTMPDEELLAVAAAGKLHEPDVLMEQARRMLKDPRVRALSTEFACQWLDIRGFDQHDEKNEALFPQFAALRGDMYEEPVRFFVDLFQRDGSVLDIVGADYTFLNESLAKHYGISGVSGSDWRKIDHVRPQGRGGIFGMAATLAKHSGASRTSPVLRGNWVSEFLLGEKLPKPPKDVPRLPEAENEGDLTVRQLTEKHRSVASCAKCHDRIDAFGFALEGFDTIGARRDKDAAGRAIDTSVTLADGATFTGVDGLRTWLLDQGREKFVRQFCRKLLGYSLGRGVQLADEPLLDEMAQSLKQHNYRFTGALEPIIRSQQFRYQRGLEATKEE
jgi:hypothetical protein